MSRQLVEVLLGYVPAMLHTYWLLAAGAAAAALLPFTPDVFRQARLSTTCSQSSYVRKAVNTDQSST